MTISSNLLWTVSFGLIAVALWPLLQVTVAFIYLNPWYPALMFALGYLAQEFGRRNASNRRA